MTRPGASKTAVRERIWSLLTARGVARFPGARGRIPNFAGADAAALRLGDLPEWPAARAIKCNPDAPQRAVRALALRQGKPLVMAVPRLRTERCFLELDPRRVRGQEQTAASLGGAARAGRPLLARQVPRLDLVVVGSVAVRRDGARVGKGGGFADLEWALLAALGVVGAWTTVVTTVHPLQVVRTAIPMLEHDLPVDYVITPAETIACPRRSRPRGLVWSALPAAKIAEIPLLRHLAERGQTNGV